MAMIVPAITGPQFVRPSFVLQQRQTGGGVRSTAHCGRAARAGLAPCSMGLSVRRRAREIGGLLR